MLKFCVNINTGILKTTLSKSTCPLGSLTCSMITGCGICWALNSWQHCDHKSHSAKRHPAIAATVMPNLYFCHRCQENKRYAITALLWFTPGLMTPYGSKGVSEWFKFKGLFPTANSQVHAIDINCVIMTYTLKLLSSLTWIKKKQKVRAPIKFTCHWRWQLHISLQWQ